MMIFGIAVFFTLALIYFCAAILIFTEKVYGLIPFSVLACAVCLVAASSLLSEYNTVYTITTHYLDKEISYPVEVEVIRTEKAAIKHQEEIAEKLYNDLNRVDSTWTIVTKDNNIVVSNGEKYYVFYRTPCKIKNK